MPFEKDLTLRFSVLLQTYAGTRVWEGCLAWVSLRGHLIPWASFPPQVPSSSSCHVWWQPRMAWRAGTAVAFERDVLSRMQRWLLNTDGLSLIPLPLSFIGEPDCWLGLGLLPKANVCPLRRSCSQPGQQLGELLVSSHAAWLSFSPQVTPEQVGEHPWACLWGKGWEVSAVLVGSHCPGQQLWHGVNETHSGRGTWKMSALC